MAERQRLSAVTHNGMMVHLKNGLSHLTDFSMQTHLNKDLLGVSHANAEVILVHCKTKR